jgi:hypothetical protein
MPTSRPRNGDDIRCPQLTGCFPDGAMAEPGRLGEKAVSQALWQPPFLISPLKNREQDGKENLTGTRRHAVPQRGFKNVLWHTDVALRAVGF